MSSRVFRMASSSNASAAGIARIRSSLSVEAITATLSPEVSAKTNEPGDQSDPIA